jgi:presqualene diphosphate synthase
LSASITTGDLRARVAGSSFYAGMRILPKTEREAMYAIYGFCRLVDDIADDELGDRQARKAALDQWRADIDALYGGGDANQAAFLSDAVRQFGLDRNDLISVIDGMQMDVDGDIRWPPFPQLDTYCDRVASAVGRLSVRVFGMEHEPGELLAHHLGRALQLTNILRDIDEDAAIGRVYLPKEALDAAGITPTTPEALIDDVRIDAAGQWLAAKAGHHFEQASAILAARPKGLLVAPRLMQLAYSRLLQRMMAQGWQPPRPRVRVSKLMLLLSAVRFSLLP